MKKRLNLIAIASIVSLSSFAQTASRVLKSDDTFGHQGMSAVNVYYGVSVFNGVYKAVAASGTDVKFSSLGPIGVMYEYFVTDNIGLGAELGYSAFKISYNYNDFDENLNPAVYNASYSFQTIRAMFRSNFHFANSSDFDAYGFLSLGYRSTTFTFASTDPFWDSSTNFSSLIPVGFKPGLGMRYFFTDNLGLNVEFALGSPLLSGGLSAKF